LGDVITDRSKLLQPLYKSQRKDILSFGYRYVEETIIKVQDSDKKGATHQGYYLVLYDNLKGWYNLCLYAQTDILVQDNNKVENSIRPVAIGRKNYLFAGSHDATQRSHDVQSDRYLQSTWH
jgi:hypothetical protein